MRARRPAVCPSPRKESPRGQSVSPAPTRARAPFWYVSLVFHVIVLTLLGCIRFAQETRILEQIFDPSRLAPPRHRVSIRKAETPKIDLDRVPAPRPVDLWQNDSQRGPGASGDVVPTADHDESADDVDSHELAGSTSAAGLLGPERGKGGQSPGDGVLPPTIGLDVERARPHPGKPGKGAAGGARFGEGKGGRKVLLAQGGGSDTTERALGNALHWLARHQGPSGSWAGFGGTHCTQPGVCLDERSFEVGVTSLAVMAFLDAGYTPSSRAVYRDEVTGASVSVGPVVAKGLQWLVSQQRPDGSFTGKVYEDAAATFAIADAAWRTGRTASLIEPARRGVGFLEAAHNPGKGWRYSARSGDDDTSATAWCLLALRAAQRVGIPVKSEVLEEGVSYIESLALSFGGIEYTKDKGAHVVTVANTASGNLCRHVAGRLDATQKALVTSILDPDQSASIWRSKLDTDKEVEPSAKKDGDRLADCEAAPQRMVFDPYSNYAVTMALFVIDGPQGASWHRWNQVVIAKDIVATQCDEKSGCCAGSWEDPGYGRVYATALNALSLTVYYRYASPASVGTR